MTLKSKQLFINKAYIVCEADIPFYICFNALAPNALDSSGNIACEDFIKSSGGKWFFSAEKLLDTKNRVAGWNVWLVWDDELVTGDIAEPSYYSSWCYPDTVQGASGQIVEIGGVSGGALSVNIDGVGNGVYLPDIKNIVSSSGHGTVLSSGNYIAVKGSTIDLYQNGNRLLQCICFEDTKLFVGFDVQAQKQLYYFTGKCVFQTFGSYSLNPDWRNIFKISDGSVETGTNLTNLLRYFNIGISFLRDVEITVEFSGGFKEAKNF